MTINPINSLSISLSFSVYKRSDEQKLGSELSNATEDPLHLLLIDIIVTLVDDLAG
ncbi:hypothetical protein Scep_004017 [Stephania cephalantha]|uniref:Uncharacterized protein n=1 Tax=Stephania cephalantha TaxID=152367 RepID=A0AAP0KT55_9MAGN